MSDNAWRDTWAEIDAACEGKGIDAYELRRAVGRRVSESGDWPKDEGMGSSDMNHLLVSAWRYDNAETLELIAELSEQAKLRVQLELAGVDLQVAALMFAPVYTVDQV